MGKRKRRTTKKKRMRRIFVIELVLLVLVVAGAILAPTMARLIKSYNQVQRTEVDDKGIGINEDLNSENIEEYTNLAVFGVDSRNNSMDRGLSDMIMLVSINNKTKEIKVVSVYRDTYLMWDEKDGKMKFRKATEVYNKGGYELALKMLNTNFDLNITDFVTVNFEAVYMAVDAVGGVDIDISEKEKSNINQYVDELNKINGTKSKRITKTGMQHLDGIQATAYGRIREIDTDFNRTERQREVMMQLFEKVKGASVGELTDLVEKLAPHVLTSLSDKEILSLAKDVASYEIVDQRGFPFEQTVVQHHGQVVAPDNLKLSVKQLHAHLFVDEEYEPSAKVKEISAALDKDLGREENTKTTMYSSAPKEGEEDGEGTSTKAGAATSSKKKSSE